MPWKLRVILVFAALPIFAWCGLMLAEAMATIYDAGRTQVSRLFAPSKPPAAIPEIPPLPAPPAAPPGSPDQPAQQPQKRSRMRFG